MWLATGASNAQVRAVASFKLGKLAARLRSEVVAGEAEQAQRSLLAADIKRFLDRPAETMRVDPAARGPARRPDRRPRHGLVLPPAVRLEPLHR